MRPTLAATIAVTALVTVTACGGGDADDPTVAVPTGTTTSAPVTAPSGPATGGAPTSSTTLTALVGTKDEPEAFEISLTDASGAAVTQLAAGTYTIKVIDESAIHNFALKGDGVEMATSVSKKESPTWTVTFKAGDYTFTCDPHPRMSGSFLVT